MDHRHTERFLAAGLAGILTEIVIGRPMTALEAADLFGSLREAWALHDCPSLAFYEAPH